VRRADHSSKESYQLSLSVRLRNLVRGGLGPIWAVSAIGWMERVLTMVYNTRITEFWDFVHRPVFFLVFFCVP
jgi:hypothetical protein